MLICLLWNKLLWSQSVVEKAETWTRWYSEGESAGILDPFLENQLPRKGQRRPRDLVRIKSGRKLKLIWRANRCFWGEKWTGNILNQEIKLALFEYTIWRASIWALDRVDWMSGTYNSKNRTKVAVSHWQNLLESLVTLPFYPWNRTERWEREREIMLFIGKPKGRSNMISNLNDEYLSQFFPDRKVLWMTWRQLFKIFIKFNMFDCIGAIFTYLHGASSTLGPFLVRKLKIFLGNLPVLGWNQFVVLVWTSQKVGFEIWQGQLL